MKHLCFVLSILNLLLYQGLDAQTCTKTVTFTELDAGPCLVGNESGGEDAAISIYCDNSLSTLLYAAEWSIDVTSVGTYTLPSTPWAACGATNSWVVGAIPSPGNSLSVHVQTYEGDDGNCLDPMDGADDCRAEATILLDLTVGTHTLSVGSDISFTYEVTETQLINQILVSDLTCTSTGLYDAELIVDYNAPVYPCSISGNLGNLVLNGQTYATTGSPQTVSMTGLTADGNSVDVTAFFNGDHSSCIYSQTGLYTAPDANTCAFVRPGGQGCRKTVTFTHVIAGEGLVGADDDGDFVEDPVLHIYCDNTLTSSLFMAEWAVSTPSIGMYPLPPLPWSACAATSNTFEIGPDVNPGTTQMPVYVQTFEGDDSDCADPMDSGDDARAEGNDILNLSAGFHTIGVGDDVVFMYEVRNIPLISNVNHISNLCVTVGEFSADVELEYDLSQSLLCGMSSGVFGNLNVNGSGFTITGSPQTVTIPNLSPNSGDIDLVTFIEGDYSSCVSEFSAIIPNHDCTILSVELLKFEALDQRSHVDLVWTTATEENADYFLLEKSFNGTDWQKLGKIKAVGNSIDENNYLFADHSELRFMNYYRLTEFDLDGSVSDLGVRAVAREAISDIYPNPCHDVLYVAGEENYVQITDVFGRQIPLVAYKLNQQTLVDVSELSAGTYFALLQGEWVQFVKL